MQFWEGYNRGFLRKDFFEYVCVFEVESSVGTNLVQFEVRFGLWEVQRFENRFLGTKQRFGRFEVRF